MKKEEIEGGRRRDAWALAERLSVWAVWGIS